MSNDRALDNIAKRLSLRKPLAESLVRLDRLLVAAEMADDPMAAMQEALGEFESDSHHLSSYERDFPNLAFAIATGVGKTRLMGAMIAYLNECHGATDFVILAPNLTIYNKLVEDFTPGSEKYVFKGLGQFATNAPRIITGDNWNSLASVRESWFIEDNVHINIFNISKLNAEARKIKSFQEVIGQSYFDYLAARGKLVVLMDEAHRYRAKASTKAVIDMQPWLGIEMTATPLVDGKKPFQNIVMDYGLGKAMKDGYVKEPYIATRRNYDPSKLSEEQVERDKLHDAIALHEQKRTELQVYAAESGQEVVKPFVLLIAQNVEHAERLQTYLESEDFKGGAYSGKVIQVHSKQSGDEKDETIEALLNVEDPENPVEIVVHVNMLREGWDVKNLYTIVPLRAGKSTVLVEQSIGRGVRLPYGRRMNNDAVDSLNIVFHDKFEEVVKAAQAGKMIALKERILDDDGPPAPKVPIEVKPRIRQVIEGEVKPSEVRGISPELSKKLEDPAERARKAAVLHVRQTQRTLPVGGTAMIEQVRQRIPVEQRLTITDEEIQKDIEETEQLLDVMTIKVPRVTTHPKGERVLSYQTFSLDCSSVNYKPVDWEILRQSLEKGSKKQVLRGTATAETRRPMDYLVQPLMDFDDIDYDDSSDLLYELAGQMVAHLQSYLETEDDLRNVLLYYQQELANIIHAQMLEHRVESDLEYETREHEGYHTLESEHFMVDSRHAADFRQELIDKSKIRTMSFTGFTKSVRATTKFDSDTERLLAIVIEDDEAVDKWIRPVKRDIHIEWEHGGHYYQPDFIVDCREIVYVCETKAKAELSSPEVQAKARAATSWCAAASRVSGRSWTYLLIPHDSVITSTTMDYYASRYALAPEVSAGATA